MRLRVRKWGNSLALRIPAAFARQTGVASGSEVELTLDGNQLIITPVPAASYSLADLLGSVTDENLHGEVDTGQPSGRESW
ncbi:MAG: AbrB/MazE/SpoVT family DNA-binding domain-containing protein [Gemmatimonadetes bacterium]|nr:AbrB/MazE/SpoVT family DNA-binding domain-containing protein [Gemmatimonadota bacterium]